MYYGERQMIEGVPGDENTAVTMRAIKDMLEEAGASDMLVNARNEPSRHEARPTGPLGALAAKAAGHGAQSALQMPPPIGAVRVRPVAAQVSEPAGGTTHDRGGLLPRIFGRK